MIHRHVDPVSGGGGVFPHVAVVCVTDVSDKRAVSVFRDEVGRDCLPTRTKHPLPIKLGTAQCHTVEKPHTKDQHFKKVLIYELMTMSDKWTGMEPVSVSNIRRQWTGSKQLSATVSSHYKMASHA